MRKKIVGVLLLAAILSVSAAGINKAHAYFTSYAEANNSNTIHLGESTHIHEENDAYSKTVSIECDSKSTLPVFVRVQAIAVNDLTYTPENAGDWTRDGDWWYYTSVVYPGETTPSLVIEGIKEGQEGVPEDSTEYNVVVVYETTPAINDSTASQNDQLQLIPRDSSWPADVFSAN